MSLTDLARNIAIETVAEVIKSAIRTATRDPAERRHIFDAAVERARSDLEAQAELDASKGR